MRPLISQRVTRASPEAGAARLSVGGITAACGAGASGLRDTRMKSMAYSSSSWLRAGGACTPFAVTGHRDSEELITRGPHVPNAAPWRVLSSPEGARAGIPQGARGRRVAVGGRRDHREPSRRREGRRRRLRRNPFRVLPMPSTCPSGRVRSVSYSKPVVALGLSSSGIASTPCWPQSRSRKGASNAAGLTEYRSRIDLRQTRTRSRKSPTGTCDPSCQWHDCNSIEAATVPTSPL